MEALTLSRSEALRSRLDYRTYRAILGPMWMPILQGVLATRAYDLGLELAFRLLEVAERFRAHLTRELYRQHEIRLYLLVLTMLDRADRWEDYLTTWDGILKRTGLTIRYSRESPDVHGAEMLPYIRRQQGQTIAVHFLYPLHHRKVLIERKVARARAGRRVGNLLHGKQEGLSGEEIRRRLAWIREMAEARTLEGKGGPRRDAWSSR
jgi:hypothetical protein